MVGIQIRHIIIDYSIIVYDILIIMARLQGIILRYIICIYILIKLNIV